MAATDLPEQLMDAGQAMLKELDNIGLYPEGAMWLFFPEVEDWRYSVITPLVDSIGRLSVYELMGLALDKIGPVQGMTIFDLHLYSPLEIMPQKLAKNQLNDARIVLRNSTLGGVLLDAVIYRLGMKLPRREARALPKKFEKRVRELA